jgi:D-tyrosyl-tRNA(Tyr) deacylase
MVGKIEEGMLILVGVGAEDRKEDAEILAEKVSKLRILSDDKGKMNLSLIDKNREVLIISQFTLFADTKKGNRPSFIKAADPKKAETIYEYFIERLKNEGAKVETGKFGGYMDIKAKLDGPVTIILDSKEK